MPYIISLQILQQKIKSHRLRENFQRGVKPLAKNGFHGFWFVRKRLLNLSSWHSLCQFRRRFLRSLRVCGSFTRVFVVGPDSHWVRRRFYKSFFSRWFHLSKTSCARLPLSVKELILHTGNRGLFPEDPRLFMLH